MARKRRIWYPGASYHIMTRGNRRGLLFKEQDDFIAYLNILYDSKMKYPFELYAYCLMSNHVHLQIKTLDVSISRIMQHINSLYASYINDTYNYVGHTFQGRYRSELIESDNYMKATNRYIHMNPVKAKMVKYPVDYRWSSYQDFFFDTEADLVDYQTFLEGFSSKEAFVEFTEDEKIYLRDYEIEAIMEDD